MRPTRYRTAAIAGLLALAGPAHAQATDAPVRPAPPGTTARIQPFVCQTQAFVLPDGSTLGQALDSDCSVAPRVDYLYRPAAGGPLLPLLDIGRLPPGIARTTTIAGRTVAFIVRLETRTINRGIHQNAVLFDPATDARPSPAQPPAGWNRRLLAVHGFGCPGGWYRQGARQGETVLDIERLGEGYALFNNTLRHPSNSCDPVVAGETAMLDKAHMVAMLGTPDFTISKGSSGGAYTSLQIADAWPGLFDGVLIGSTFPDALSIALAGLDARLLDRWFRTAGGAALTPAQQTAISGFKSLEAFHDMARQAQRADPVVRPADALGYRGAVWPDAVPPALRYDPVTNPRGARPTVFDVARHSYGIDPQTGFARRPFDNEGVAYGLAALEAGVIDVDRFLDLNAAIGGYDRDANFTAARSRGDPVAIDNAQRTGLALGGGGGLASIPVLDASGGLGFLYDEDRGYHYQWFHFAVRERMRRRNGHAENHVMWRGGIGFAESIGKPSADQAAFVAAVGRESWSAIVDWVAAIAADRAGGPPRERMRRNRPARLVDGCWTPEPDPRFIAEPQVMGIRPTTRCNTLYPSWSFVRAVAGAPVAADVYRCTLRPIDVQRMRTRFSPAQQQRMRAVFPTGVCDFDRAGRGDRAVAVRPLPAALAR